ncbi:MAG: hypothetical protein Q7J85_00710 [Bacillota bacterium]|nr:hypothetical protein [Bacillota bacterium]
MVWLGFISYIILVIVAVAAWSNTKIILEEIKEIKKHLGIQDDEPVDIG